MHTYILPSGAQTFGRWSKARVFSDCGGLNRMDHQLGNISTHLETRRRSHMLELAER